MNNPTIAQIRENERISHIQSYSSATLFQNSGWLQKPVKTVMELLPDFENRPSLTVLDLGCGVGRNAIPIAKHFSSIPCRIDCVDILDLAIEKLTEYARHHGVLASIHGILCPIEDFVVPESHYDLILAVSALEHVASSALFEQKLQQIACGIKPGGTVCFIINSDVTEQNSLTGAALPAQFEVNLPTQTILDLLHKTYQEWEVQKCTIRHQQYNIPRESIMSSLHTTVVTFVAEKTTDS